MVFLPGGRALATVPGWEKRKTPPDRRVGAPRVAGLEPYRPRYRAGIGTLAVIHQVAGRFTGPEPSAQLSILLRMKGARLDQAVEGRHPMQMIAHRHGTARRRDCVED